ncbi:MAG: A24 family peptidase [Microbacterium sp.]|uniref:prepilin peptidase n=1 Tax=Microbacterium sp. TaxID=51671 RepID=UPI0039E6D491
MGFEFAADIWLWSAHTVVVVAYAAFAVVGVVLAVIDLRSHRLPNRIVLPSYVGAMGLLALACLLGADWWQLARAGAGMAAMFMFYFALRLVRPAGMGGGDVKLSGVVGLFLGWAGWAPLVVGALAAFLLGGIAGLVLMAARKADRRTAIPFGPFMLLGAWVGIVAGDALAGLQGGSHVV